MSARVGVRDPRLVGARLTNREHEVLAAAADGCTMSGTADRLFLSTDTVRKHRATMMDKLGARNIVHAVHLAHESGLL